MKILWITNCLLPSINDKLGITKGASGGWMEAAANNLLKEFSNIELAVVSTWNKITSGSVDNLRFYTIPSDIYTRSENERKDIWNNIVNDFNPDVVHIHGTEFSHGLSYLKDVGGDNIVISIQGLVSVIQRYMMADITSKDIWRNITVHEILTRSMLGLRKRFKQKGENEREYIRDSILTPTFRVFADNFSEFARKTRETYSASAMASISQRTFFGRVFTATQLRAGRMVKYRA